MGLGLHGTGTGTGNAWDWDRDRDWAGSEPTNSEEGINMKEPGGAEKQCQLTLLSEWRGQHSSGKRLHVGWKVSVGRQVLLQSGKQALGRLEITGQ